jgi:hypothetical protein
MTSCKSILLSNEDKGGVGAVNLDDSLNKALITALINIQNDIIV